MSESVVLAVVVVGAVVVTHSSARALSPASAARQTTAPATAVPHAGSGGPAPTPQPAAPSLLPRPAKPSLPALPLGTGFLTLGGEGGVVITPQEADTVVYGLWTMREKAFAEGNATALNGIETSSAASVDLSAVACQCFDYTARKP